MDGLTLATLVPVGAVLPLSVATFFLGLGAGGLANRGLDGFLRARAVQRAVAETVQAMEAGARFDGGQAEAVPGMPYRRAS